MTALTVGGLMVVFILGIASAWARPQHRLRLLRQRRPTPAGGVPDVLPRDPARSAFLGLASWLAVFPASRLALDKAGLSGEPHDPHHGLVEALGGYSGDDGDLTHPEPVDGEPSACLDPSDRPAPPRRPDPRPDPQEPVR